MRLRLLYVVVLSTVTAGAACTRGDTRRGDATVSAVVVRRCEPEALGLRLASATSVMNQPAFFLTFTNQATEACALRGHPSVQLVGADGAPVDQAVAPGGGYIVEDPPVRAVTLEPEGMAWFVVSSVRLCTSAPDAVDASALLVAPPEASKELRVELAVPYCPGEPRVTVTSVQPSEASLLADGDP